MYSNPVHRAQTVGRNYENELVVSFPFVTLRGVLFMRLKLGLVVVTRVASGGKNKATVISIKQRQQVTSLFILTQSRSGGDNGGSSFLLACEDFGGRFDDSFPVRAFFFFSLV